MQSSFPIGTWLFTDLDAFTKRDVEHWRDCGLTLTMSPNYDPERHDINKMLEIMDYCHECGIRLVVCDKRTRWVGASTDPVAYKKGVEEAYKDFGKHPATFGFYLGDEPRLVDTDDVVAAHKIHLEVAPELTPFLNNHPFWGPMIEEIGDAMFPRLKGTMKLMSYDYYVQMRKVPDFDRYFKQLKRFKELADEHGCPLWTTVLCSGHMDYLEPTRDDFIWQLNTAVASGCEGVFWYRFYSGIKLKTNYRNAPINKFGERTLTYMNLADANREFHLEFGDYMSKLKFQKSYHVEKAFGGFDLFKEGDSDIVATIEDSRNHNPLIMTFYKDEETGEDYIAVVNNSKTDNSLVKHTFYTKAGKIINPVTNITITPNITTAAMALVGIEATKEEDKVPDTYDYTCWYAPGQMQLYKIVKE